MSPLKKEKFQNFCSDKNYLSSGSNIILVTLEQSIFFFIFHHSGFHFLWFHFFSTAKIQNIPKEFFILSVLVLSFNLNPFIYLSYIKKHHIYSVKILIFLLYYTIATFDTPFFFLITATNFLNNIYLLAPLHLLHPLRMNGNI